LVIDECFQVPVLIQEHKMRSDAITNFNRDGVDFLTEQTDQAIKADDFKLGERLDLILSTEFAHRPEALFLRSRLARLNGRADEEVHPAEQAFELDPADAPQFHLLCPQYIRAKHPETVEPVCERI